MAEELRLNIVSTADSKGFDKAAKDISEAKAEAKGLSDTWAKASANAEDLQQSTDDATKSVKAHGEQVRVLRAEYEKTTKRIAELDAQLLGGGDPKAIQKNLREQRAWLAEVQRVAKEVQRASGIKFSLSGGGEPVMSGVLEGILGGIPQLGGVPPQVIAGGVAIGAALAPGISAGVAGALIGTVGAGGIVGGTLLAARDGRVRAGIAELADVFLETMEPAGAAFVQPVLNSIDILESELKKGRLSAALEAAAPLTERFTKGIAGFVNEASDGLKTMFDRSGPLFDLWEKEMPETGQAVGYFFSAISADAPGAAKGLKDVFDVIQAGTRMTGDAIGGLTVLNDLLQFPGVGDALNNLPLDGTLGAINRFANGPELQKVSQGMAGFTIATQENRLALMDDAIAAETTRRRVQDLAIAQADAAVKARDLKDAWGELHGAQMTLDEALKRAYDQLEVLKKEFEGTDDAVKGNTQSAVENRLAMEQQAAAAIAAAQAYLDMTGDTAGAQKILDEFKNSAVKATGATGNAKKAVDELATALFKLPESRVVRITIYKRTFEGTFRADERGTLGAPGYETTVEGRASGGRVMAGIPYKINERGRETVTFPAGGQVHPANLSPMGGGYSAPLVLNFPAGSYEQALIETISSAVQARGGQLGVLGLKAA